jgi:hypothetical protein
MTQRERRLALILGGIVVVGGVFLAYQLILRPLREYDDTIASLEAENQTAQDQINKIREGKKQLNRWRFMSLPVDPARPNDTSLASREYGRFLSELMHKNRLDVESFTPVDAPTISAQVGKKPVYTPLTYNVRAKASLGNLVQMMEQFQRAPLLHRIKSLTIARVENTVAARKKRDDVVTVQMTVEALVVNGAQRRLGFDPRLLALDALMVLAHRPGGIALAPSVLNPTGPLWPRQLTRSATSRKYADIAKKNIFLGPLAPGEDLDDGSSAAIPGGEIQVTRYTYLTDITVGVWRAEAWIYIRTNKHKTRLRESPGFNAFRIMDERDDGPELSGKVLKIESRDLYFQVGTNYYVIHVGQNFAEAMRRRLPESEVKSLGLVASTK